MLKSPNGALNFHTSCFDILGLLLLCPHRHWNVTSDGRLNLICQTAGGMPPDMSSCWLTSFRLVLLGQTCDGSYLMLLHVESLPCPACSLTSGSRSVTVYTELWSSSSHCAQHDKSNDEACRTCSSSKQTVSLQDTLQKLQDPAQPEACVAGFVKEGN